ncbi:hypothetical protein RND81_01G193200 [Saponaria officinalis]|uniref:Uncharacterized protein n=2 Tax=Saponaria officinalis TaxID=3572 RepID=A0AAW1NB34_SAPOF
MNITSITPKSSKKFLQSLKPLIPKFQFSSIHSTTENPSFNSHIEPQQLSNHLSFSSSSSLSVTQIIEILKSNNKESWNSNEELSQSLNCLSSDNFLQITRNLESSSIALHFVEHLKSNPRILDGESMSVMFQAVFDLASREPGKLFEVYSKAVEWNVGLGVNSVTHLIRCFSRANLIDKSMLVFSELDTQMKNVHVRNVVIDELLRNRRLDDALQVLDDMLEPNSEVLPDENTMDIVFPALFRGKVYGRWVSDDEFVEIVARFVRRGVFPNSITLTKWISGFCRSKRTNVAWNVLHTVMELGGPVEVASCNALLTGLNKAREFDKMNSLMKTMQDKGIVPNVVTLGISINHLCKAMRVDEALNLFEKLRRGEISADIKPDVVLYNTLIDGLCKLGRVEEGLSMMRRMSSESECSPSTITFNCLIDGFCKAGDIDKALELFDEMEKEDVERSIVTVNVLVSGLCRHGRAGGALKLYREMQEKGFDGNAVTYTTLISGFCGVNNVRKAMDLLGEMKGKCPTDAIVYYTLISGFSQAGLMDEVESVVTEMKNAGFRPDIGCYNVMINGFCQKNKLEKAHQLLKDMDTDGLKPDSFTYNTLISYFSKIGDLKTSHEILSQMMKDKIVPTVVTFGVLINAFCSAGQLQNAMKIFKEIKHSTRVPPNTVIYNTLIDCHCRNNMVKGALSLFGEMLGKDVKPNTNTFNALFKALRDEKQLGKALELMDKMTEQGCSPDYITLEVLTQWLPAVGETEKLRLFVEGHTVSSSSMEC